MKTLTYAAAATAICAIVAAGAAAVSAEDEQPLVIEGETLTTTVKVDDDHPLAPEVRSGWLYRTPETQVLETDDFQNPAMLLVQQAEELWTEVDGSAGKACESCHGDAQRKHEGRARPHAPSGTRRPTSR